MVYDLCCFLHLVQSNLSGFTVHSPLLYDLMCQGSESASSWPLQNVKGKQPLMQMAFVQYTPAYIMALLTSLGRKDLFLRDAYVVHSKDAVSN